MVRESMNENKEIKVAVLGAGLMGHGIAQSFMVAGFNVSIWDPDSATLAKVIPRIQEHLQALGQDLVRQVDELNPNCIFATNTSVLRVSEIAEKSSMPHRVVGTH